MTDPTMTEVKDRLERLSHRGSDPGAEWLVAAVRRARSDADVGVDPRAVAPGRRPLVSSVVAFIAVVAITVAAVAVVRRDHRNSPASPPNPTAVRPAPTSVAIESVSTGPSEPALVSRTEGWVCDKPLRHTLDAGKSWESIRVPFVGECEFLPDGRAWVGLGGDGIDQHPRIARVVAGGADPTMTVVDLPESTPQTVIASLTFIGDHRGWALTSLQLDKAHHYRNRYDLYATIDDGLHWRLLVADAPVSGSLVFTSAARGWAVDGSNLRRTADGGHTWRRVSAPLPPTISDAPSFNSVFVFGHRIVAGGVRPLAKSPIVGTSVSVATTGDGFVDTSNDDGRTWSLHKLPKEIQFPLDFPAELDAPDASHWRMYQYDIWITNDTGRSWQRVGNALFAALGAGSDPAVRFFTRDLGLATICKDLTTSTSTTTALPPGPGVNAPCRPRVAGTTDGGLTWSTLAQL